MIKTKRFDKIFARNAENIESFAYVTPDLKNIPDAGVLNQKCSDNARINNLNIDMYGLQPSMFDSTINDFLDVNYQSPTSGLTLSEQLFTARGSQSVAVGSYVTDFTSTDPKDFRQTILLQTYSNTKSKTNKYYRKRPLWTANQAPAYTMRDRSAGNPAFVMNLPSYVRMLDPFISINETKWERVFVRMKDPANKTATDKLITYAKSQLTAEEANGIRIFNFYDDTDTMEEVQLILDIIFNVIISITMFLCFFSLCSSMSANLMDQTAEIGVLRAMGFTKFRIKLLYFYEAFILVSASCLLGVMIGVIVGFTMVLQQVVFTSIPIVFYFPWTQFGMIMFMSLLCAWAATWGPASQLVSKEIAVIFRAG